MGTGSANMLLPFPSSLSYGVTCTVTVSPLENPVIFNTLSFAFHDSSLFRSHRNLYMIGSSSASDPLTFGLNRISLPVLQEAQERYLSIVEEHCPSAQLSFGRLHLLLFHHTESNLQQADHSAFNIRGKKIQEVAVQSLSHYATTDTEMLLHRHTR